MTQSPRLLQLKQGAKNYKGYRLFIASISKDKAYGNISEAKLKNIWENRNK